MLDSSLAVTTITDSVSPNKPQRRQPSGSSESHTNSEVIKRKTRCVSDAALNPSVTHTNRGSHIFSEKKNKFKKSDDKKESPRKKSPKSDLLTTLFNPEKSTSSSESKESMHKKEPSPRKTSPRSDLFPTSQYHTEKSGNTVKFAYRSSVAGSEQAKDLNILHKKMDEEKLREIKERLKNQGILQNLFNSLKTVMAKKDLCLDIDDYNCVTIRKGHSNDSKNQKILSHLYSTLIESLSLNPMFCCSKGTLVSLQDVDELITKIYPERDNIVETIRLSVLKSFHNISKNDQRYKDCKNLEISQFPKDTSIFQINKIHITEEQNLNEKSKLILIVEEIKNELIHLNRKVTEFIHEDETPLIQKITVMNFYKSRVENYYMLQSFLKGWVSNPLIDQKVLDRGFLSKEEIKIMPEATSEKYAFLRPFNEEIECLSVWKNSEYEKQSDNALDVEDFLNELPLPRPNSPKMHQVLNIISNDLKIYSAQTFKFNTFDTCILSTSSPYADDTTGYCNSLVNFIYKNFNTLQQRYKLSHDNKHHNFTESFFNLYMFFVNLGCELIQKHDYLSSMAIYTALENPAIEWVIKNKKDIPTAFQNNLSKFSETCSLEGNCVKLREIMKDCQLNKVFHTPSLYLYLKIINNFELLSLKSNNPEEAKSLEIKNINDFFNELRINFETAYKKHTPQSDIFYQISSCSHSIEPIKPDSKLIHPSKKSS